MFGYAKPPGECAAAGGTGTVPADVLRTLPYPLPAVRAGGRFILNYDFTYLAILLSSGEEGRRSEARCYTSPLKKRAYLEPDAAMELAADESVILAYWQLRDGIADHGLVSGLKYRAGGGAFGARLSKGCRAAAGL